MPRGALSLEELAGLRTENAPGADGTSDETDGATASDNTPAAESMSESPTERRRRERAEARAARTEARAQAATEQEQSREERSRQLYDAAVAHLQEVDSEAAAPEYVSPFSRVDWLETTSHTASGRNCPGCRAQRQATRSAFRVLEAEESFTMTDSQGAVVEITLNAGDRVVTRENHTHDGHRRTSCALCMALFEHNRQATPTSTTSSKTPKDCACGCGGQTRGGRFLPGHDAKLSGLIRGYQKWAIKNAEAIESGEIEPGAYERIGEIPQGILEMGVEGPGGTCSCCGAPLLEPDESGMGPICRSGGCRCAARRAAGASS